MTDLDEFMAYPEADEQPETPVGVEQANAMLRRVARLQREREQADALAAHERETVDLWLSTEHARIDGQLAGLRAALANYHAARLGEDPRAKTIRLPAGELKATERARWEFTAEFLAWAEGNAPELVRRKPAPAPELDKTAAKSHLVVRDGVVVTAAGEVPPGVAVTTGVDFAAKPSLEVTR